MLPQRMCSVCRKRRGKDDLLRVVRCIDGNIRIDKDGKFFGRGAYICKGGSCAKQAAKRRVLERALACTVERDVYDELEEMSEDENE